MSDAVLEHARAACRQVQDDRAWRFAVRAAAREGRRRARDVRERSVAERERLLERSWRLWSSGWVAQPPRFVPPSWETGACDGDQAVERAATECGRAARSVLRSVERAEALLPFETACRAPSVVALCEVAAERLEDEPEIAVPLVSACARALDGLERSAEAGPPDASVVALAVACRAAGGGVRRALAGLHEHGLAR